MPTFRVIYDPRPGVRLLIEDIEADAIIETPLHLVLTVDALVVGRPRQVVALRVRRSGRDRDLAAVPYVGPMGRGAAASLRFCSWTPSVDPQAASSTRRSKRDRSPAHRRATHNPTPTGDWTPSEDPQAASPTRSNTASLNLQRAELNGLDLACEGGQTQAADCADLREADLRRASLAGANLHGANLQGANLADADLIGANLTDVDLAVADLTGADLIEADLSGADLSSAEMVGAIMFRANLPEADLSDTNLTNADLNEATLPGADLTGADLIGADLWGAYLGEADLSGANLSGANLSCAILFGAIVTREQIDDAASGDASTPVEQALCERG